MVTAREALAVLALLGAPAGTPTLVAAPALVASQASPALASLVVLGLENRVEKKAWRDRRLGVGLRGWLAQMCADSGAFTLLEEKELAASIQEALGGYWLSRSEEHTSELQSR